MNPYMVTFSMLGMIHFILAVIFGFMSLVPSAFICVACMTMCAGGWHFSKELY